MTQNQTSTYTLTLIDGETGKVLSTALAPVLPRHIYVSTSGTAELSDSSEPSAELGLNVEAFDRLASAVWVDDDRSALFVRRSPA